MLEIWFELEMFKEKIAVFDDLEAYQRCQQIIEQYAEEKDAQLIINFQTHPNQIKTI